MNKELKLNCVALTSALLVVGCAPSDSVINSAVKTGLTTDEKVKTAQIEVGVQNKVVTLSGSVDTEGVKQRAVEVARQTNGVSEVVDRMNVKEQGPGPGFGHEMMRNERSGDRDIRSEEKQK